MTDHPRNCTVVRVADSAQPDVCAVVVTCNRKELLAEALSALAEQTLRPTRIVVVDNASSDGTAELLRTQFPEVRALHLKENVGGAGGFHLGMRWAHEQGSEWLWVMDDDTIPSRTALSELLAARERFNGRDQPNLLASKVVWTDGSLHTMNPCLVKQPDLEALYRSVEQRTMSIRTSTFVSCLLHRDLVTRYGLPIADYFIWGDDTEYTARVLRAEFGVMVPASVAVHKTANKHTALNAPPERYYYHVRNTLWMITRSSAWTGKEKLRLAITLAAWIGRYFRIRGVQFASVKAVAAGLLDGLFSSPRNLKLEALLERGLSTSGRNVAS